MLAMVMSGVVYVYILGIRTCRAWTLEPNSRAMDTAKGNAASDGSEKSVRYKTFLKVTRTPG
jgi:hypothetical protein